MMINKLFSGFFLVIFFCLSGCASASGLTATETVKENLSNGNLPGTLNKTDIVIWHSYGVGTPDEEAFSKLIKQAGVDFPEYKIIARQIPPRDLMAKFRDESIAGKGPDLLLTDNDALGDDVRGGYLANLDQLAAGKIGSYNPIAIEGLTVNGILYGIPESINSTVFWYNKETLPAPPKSTDDLKKLMENGQTISMNYNCAQTFGFFNAFGGNIFNGEWKIVADKSPGIAEALAYLDELYQISKNNNLPRSDADGYLPFTNGKVSAIVNGTWALNEYKKALGENLAVSPLPRGPKGVAKPLLGVRGYFINAKSRNFEDAFKLALYLTNGNSETIMANEAGHIPSRNDVKASDPIIANLISAVSEGYTIRPQVPELGKYWTYFCNTVEIFEGRTSPTDFVKNAVDKANK